MDAQSIPTDGRRESPSCTPALMGTLFGDTCPAQGWVLLLPVQGDIVWALLCVGYGHGEQGRG